MTTWVPSSTSRLPGIPKNSVAGVALRDMEFVQYHPTGLPFTGILITEAARAEGGYLINKDGYRYLQDYNLGTPSAKPVFRSMELGPRDRLSQAFMKELEKGRTIETPYTLTTVAIGPAIIASVTPASRKNRIMRPSWPTRSHSVRSASAARAEPPWSVTTWASTSTRRLR